MTFFAVCNPFLSSGSKDSRRMGCHGWRGRRQSQGGRGVMGDVRRDGRGGREAD